SLQIDARDATSYARFTSPAPLVGAPSTSPDVERCGIDAHRARLAAPRSIGDVRVALDCVHSLVADVAVRDHREPPARDTVPAEARIRATRNSAPATSLACSVR